MSDHRIPSAGLGEQGVIWTRVAAIAVLLGTVAIIAVALSSGRPGTVDVTIPAGTSLVGALEQTVSTKNAEVGDVVALRTTDPIELDEQHVLPAGALVKGEVTHSKGGGRIAGAPELTIRFTRLEVQGEEHAIRADPFRVKGKDDAAESALTVGGGAVAGAVVGAITGSAERGALIGAVLGTGVAVATEGDHIVLPAGQKVRIRIADPVTVALRQQPSGVER